MATIVLSAAGMALGGSIGGSVLGLSMATLGRAAGATLGRVIDQRILGAGSEPVETGRVDRFRLMGASEGAVVQQIYGRMRVAGQVIWATQFAEQQFTSAGGKGAGPKPATTTFSYRVSLAVALCEGQISRVGRIWADGVEVAADALNMRVYVGSQDQSPDPKITAVQGAQNTPAYRGIAYVVFEDLPLDRFGNRVPQFTFEVMRPAAPDAPADQQDLSSVVTGVAMIPGTGEYSLATTPVYLSPSYGEQVGVNMNTPTDQSDFLTATDALTEELPNCTSTLLVVSWFGSDLRCGECVILPKVEQKQTDAAAMPWSVSGISRAGAALVPTLDDRPVYGGTPADAAVTQAIRELRGRGLRPVFYPFILMEQLAGNDLPDPWTGEPDQPTLPWRGRITLDTAPGQTGSVDQTAAAPTQVMAFMGAASVTDFTVAGDTVTYTGPANGGYRRFILHYAHLCAAAGGVSAFCIGSEMRAFTQIRGPGGTFPAVAALRQLAADVRGILGPDCKISYAADWSEYHGYQPTGTGDKVFHLDPLWADPNIDFIGIDNYMPLSDWRDGDDHADADWGAIYNLDYLQSNVAGGEGYDWYYPTPEARDAQRRSPITDGDDEPWVWRYKDIAGWWRNAHHNRIDGVRQRIATPWVPQSKPVWFTELGCAAIDKGTNQPNKFLDPKSSESQLPHYSNGMRDDFMQMQYLRAIYGHYGQAANNPVSTEYNAPMVAMDRAHVWAWDARPFPWFPANQSLWSDGDNYARGHWLNGRASSRTLASVVAEICDRSGVTQYDVSRLYGIVRGYVVGDIGTARAALQPLMLAHGFEASERDGMLVFRNRTGGTDHIVTDDTLALDPEQDSSVTLTRAPAAEIAGRVQLEYVDADADYEAGVAEAISPDEVSFATARSTFPLALTRAEGTHIAARWIAEARVAKDSARFALPPSHDDVGAGDVVSLRTQGQAGSYRIDRVEEAGLRLIEATRVDPEVYLRQEVPDVPANLKPFVSPVPVEMLFMDLPLLTGDEVPHAPHVATSARPWPGPIALYTSAQDSNYAPLDILTDAAMIGILETPLESGPIALWDRQAPISVKFMWGSVSAADPAAVLAGANTIAIGDGTPANWEIVQFAQSQPIAARTFALSMFLRGQAGTDALMPDVWPAGSRVVVLNGTPRQINLPAATRGTMRHFRYGPTKRDLGDPSYRYASFAFQGNGLRPYPVVHLQAKTQGSSLDVRWIRQTRIDGDDWTGPDVPLGEDTESYVLRIIQSGIIRREVTLDVPHWTYNQTDCMADTGGAPFTLMVAQISARFGVGPFRQIVRP